MSVASRAISRAATYTCAKNIRGWLDRSLLLSRSKVKSQRSKVTSKVQGCRCKVPRCKVEGARSKVQGRRCKVEGARYALLLAVLVGIVAVDARAQDRQGALEQSALTH